MKADERGGVFSLSLSEGEGWGEGAVLLAFPFVGRL